MNDLMVGLFPKTTRMDQTLDEIDEDTQYDVVEFEKGYLIGVVGVRFLSDEEYGYDRVFGWAAEFGNSQDKPLKTLDEAVKDLLNAAKEATEGEL